MGYFSKPIASETIKPAKVSLSGTSNFLEFTAEKEKDEKGNDKKDKQVQVVFSYDAEIPEGYVFSETTITFAEVIDADKKHISPNTTLDEEVDSDKKHIFKGTTVKDRVNDTTFFWVDGDVAATIENIRACMMKNIFFRNNFSLTIPFAWDGQDATNGEYLLIESLGVGEKYNFEMISSSLTVEKIIKDDKNDVKPDVLVLKNPFKIGEGSDDSLSFDQIDYGSGDKEIEVEVYTDLDIFLGQSDLPSSNITPGKLITTLSKSYSGQPIWFDINSLMSTDKRYSDKFLFSGEVDNNANFNTWVDAGTMSSVRLIAKTNDSVRRDTFYYSEVLHIITGYARTLSKVDMQEYIFRRAFHYPHKFKPLTNQPVLTHQKGQSQFFNFIFSDPFHKKKNEKPTQQDDSYNLGLHYEFYTQSGVFIAEKRSLMQHKDKFYEVNTVKLDLDEMIEKIQSQEGKIVGKVKVALCDDVNVASQALEFEVMPHCLSKVNDFAFLNALGGWSSFNFSGEKTLSVKSDATTYYQTLLPRFTESSRVQSVLDKEVEESFTVKTAPITASVADWLKELSASIAVYEISTKRYIVVDDFNIKHTTKEDLFVLEMKYHYSDTFNAVIK